MYIPERSCEPPEPKYIIGGEHCMHEIYEGENGYEWEGELLCPDCFKEKVAAMSLEEWAEILNVDVTKVRG